MDNLQTELYMSLVVIGFMIVMAIFIFFFVREKMRDDAQADAENKKPASNQAP